MYYLYDFTAGEKISRSECTIDTEAFDLARTMSRDNDNRNAHVIAVIEEYTNRYMVFFYNGEAPFERS